MSNKIWLSSPHMGQSELQYVNEAFQSNWIAPLGPNVDKFEHRISEYLGSYMHTSALVSGTAAIHLALRILDIGPGDVVMVQSFTFCGTTNPVLYQGAEIVYIDSELETWNMCPNALEDALKAYKNKSVKAILPVHLYGMPAQIDAIRVLADQYGVPVIEDAAESFGSSYKQKKCGSFGDLAALSFNGNKIITTSGGGALVSSNKRYIEKARFLASQARDHAPHYQHSEVGFNYRMSNVLAGIGCGQMEVLDLRVQQRRANNRRYRDYFNGIPGIKFQDEPNEDYFSNYWLTGIIFDQGTPNGISKEQIHLTLEAENIESRPLWKPMHMQPISEGSRFFGSGKCENMFQNGLCLPSGSNLSDQDFDRIFKTLNKVFKK